MKTYRDMLNEIENYPYSRERYELMRENMDITTRASYLEAQQFMTEHLEMVMESSDQYFLESADNQYIQAIYEETEEKEKSFIQKAIAFILKPVNFLLSLLKKLVKTVTFGKIDFDEKYITAEDIYKLEQRAREKSEVFDYISIHGESTAKDASETKVISQVKDLIKDANPEVIPADVKPMLTNRVSFIISSEKRFTAVPENQSEKQSKWKDAEFILSWSQANPYIRATEQIVKYAVEKINPKNASQKITDYQTKDTIQSISNVLEGNKQQKNMQYVMDFSQKGLSEFQHEMNKLSTSLTSAGNLLGSFSDTGNQNQEKLNVKSGLSNDDVILINRYLENLIKSYNYSVKIYTSISSYQSEFLRGVSEILELDKKKDKNKKEESKE